MSKAAIQTAFNRAALTYNQNAVLQRACGNLLLELQQAKSSDLCLDLGCGPGFFANILAPKVKQLYCLDLAEKMLAQTKILTSKYNNVSWLQADAEQLPLVDNCIDSVFSNLVLQWSSDLKQPLAEIKRILRPQGSAYIATIGAGSLSQLKDAWAAVDNYQHVNQFLNQAEIEQAIVAAGFTNYTIVEQQLTFHYSDIYALLTSLKGIGATFIVNNRNLGLTGKNRFKNLASKYKACPQGLPLTYNIILVSITK